LQQHHWARCVHFFGFVSSNSTADGVMMHAWCGSNGGQLV
jgi:hypothetical protein